MKISIVTTTYNSASTIKDTLESVNSQTYANIEHIIVDGASKDHTLEIVKQYGDRVAKIISEPDKGIYDAFNKGVAVATGDVIGFVHSDDTLANPSTIEKIVALFIADISKSVAGIFGNLVFIDKSNKVVRNWTSTPFERRNIGRGWMPPHPTLYLRREVYKKHGPFDISFKIAGDYDFMLRVMKDDELNLSLLPEVITKMRVGGASTGNLKQLLNKSNEDMRALRKNGFKYPLRIIIIKMILKFPQLLKR